MVGFTDDDVRKAVVADWLNEILINGAKLHGEKPQVATQETASVAQQQPAQQTPNLLTKCLIYSPESKITQPHQVPILKFLNALCYRLAVLGYQISSGVY